MRLSASAIWRLNSAFGERYLLPIVAWLHPVMSTKLWLHFAAQGLMSPAFTISKLILTRTSSKLGALLRRRLRSIQLLVWAAAAHLTAQKQPIFS